MVILQARGLTINEDKSQKQGSFAMPPIAASEAEKVATKNTFASSNRSSATGYSAAPDGIFLLIP